MPRPLIVGPDELEPPYPVFAESPIEAGFGRGSAELGIPTVNIPPKNLAELDPGVYYGWCSVAPLKVDGSVPKERVEKVGERSIEFNYGAKLYATEIDEVYPMVMSIGWNPFFANKEKSAEIHILHEFADQFYGAVIKVAVTGFIRNEQKYDSLEALIEDIHTDVDVAKRSLERPAYVAVKHKLAG